MAEGRAEFGIGRGGDAWSASLDRPLAMRRADALDDVLSLVEWVEHAAVAGRWGVLVLAYEAAPAFDPALVVGRPAAGFPLAWAATYADAAPARLPLDAGAAADVPWRPTVSEVEFGERVRRILAHIAAGDTYQVNCTFPLNAPFTAEPWAWYAACATQADVPFAASIDLGSSLVMSLSPELFLERHGQLVRARPMKGTARRGRWLAEDVRLAEALERSDKARAENVMIVDLLRNDLGRVAQTGSVRVRDLCGVERYPTVWQLTSTIEATLRPATSLVDVLRATFPCGSVTGAPKVRTMEIIAALEAAPRGIYTGMIALLRPGGDFVSSVPIRTAVVDPGGRSARFHVGAGITADSDAAEEWAECLAKARVVRPPAVPTDAALFETMRLEGGVLARRDRHVARLAASAELFGWPCDQAAIEQALDRLLATRAAGLWRVRLTLSRDGAVAATATPFEDEQRPWQVVLASTPVDVRSPLLFNKTTRRDAYDAARAAAPAADDVILWNARREVTECTIGNLVVEIDGRRLTPPVACGLLPGVMREQLLADGLLDEAVVTVDELPRATRLWLVNSLRGWVPLALHSGAADGRG